MRRSQGENFTLQGKIGQNRGELARTKGEQLLGLQIFRKPESGDGSSAALAFPVPRWARVTSFVGMYVLVLAGAVALQRALEALLDVFGLDGAALDGAGVVAGLYLGATGLRRLLYDANSAGSGRGLYRTAWSLAAVLAGTAVTVVVSVVLRFAAPEGGTGWFAGAVPPFAMALTLLAAEPVIWIAVRRRAGMRAEDVESEADEETSPPA